MNAHVPVFISGPHEKADMASLGDPEFLFAVDLLNNAEPDETRVAVRLADDLMRANVFADRRQLAGCLAKLHEVLADETLSSAELKGVLNRASGSAWGFEYDRKFTPRQFLEALGGALEDYLRRNRDLR